MLPNDPSAGVRPGRHTPVLSDDASRDGKRAGHPHEGRRMRNPPAIWSQLRQFALAEADVVLYSVRITAWLRWLVALVVVFLLACRPRCW